MSNYGQKLYRDGKHEEGKKWLRKALDLGFGDAGFLLCIYYNVEKNAPMMIKSLRDGSKLGSEKCLTRLAAIYNSGNYAQTKDLDYVKKIRAIIRSIPKEEVAQPIDLDVLLPSKKVLPYQYK